MSDMPAPQHAELQADKRRDFDTDKPVEKSATSHGSIGIEPPF